MAMPGVEPGMKPEGFTSSPKGVAKYVPSTALLFLILNCVYQAMDGLSTLFDLKRSKTSLRH
jgi:hypothetical protein